MKARTQSPKLLYLPLETASSLGKPAELLDNQRPQQGRVHLNLLPQVLVAIHHLQLLPLAAEGPQAAMSDDLGLFLAHRHEVSGIKVTQGIQ